MSADAPFHFVGGFAEGAAANSTRVLRFLARNIAVILRETACLRRGFPRTALFAACGFL